MSALGEWFWALETDPLIPAIEVDPNTVTPGVVGFLLTLFVSLSVFIIIADMTRRVRRVRYRSEIRERLDREEFEAADDGPEHPAREARPPAGD